MSEFVSRLMSPYGSSDKDDNARGESRHPAEHQPDAGVRSARVVLILPNSLRRRSLVTRSHIRGEEADVRRLPSFSQVRHYGPFRKIVLDWAGACFIVGAAMERGWGGPGRRAAGRDLHGAGPARVRLRPPFSCLRK